MKSSTPTTNNVAHNNTPNISDNGIDENTLNISDNGIHENTLNISDNGIHENTLNISDNGIDENTLNIADNGIDENTLNIADNGIDENTSNILDDGIDKNTSNIYIDDGMYGETRYIHEGVLPDPVTGAITMPIYHTTTFVQESVELYLNKGYSYSRSANPTVRALEKRIHSLEGGADAACFTTGMAATVTILTAYLSAGDHFIIPKCVYGGTFRAANEYLSRFGVEYDYVDFRDPRNVEIAIKKNTKLIFCETPANPTLYLTDLEAIDMIIGNEEMKRLKNNERLSNTNDILHSLYGGKRTRERSIIFVVDSTFATPYSLNPMKYGADIVMHSTTKYFDGHNITTGGVAVSRFPEYHAKIAYTRNICGCIMDPQTAFYTLNTLMTLPLRFRRQSNTAKTIALFLEKHPKVERVLYPGLQSHPQRSLALKYHRDDLNGGLLGFYVKGGIQAGIKLMNTIGYPFSLCENLGSAQSLITCPAVFTHAQMTKEQRLAIGITDGYIRVSIGLENTQDLINALNKALNELQ